MKDWVVLKFVVALALSIAIICISIRFPPPQSNAESTKRVLEAATRPDLTHAKLQHLLAGLEALAKRLLLFTETPHNTSVR